MHHAAFLPFHWLCRVCHLLGVASVTCNGHTPPTPHSFTRGGGVQWTALLPSQPCAFPGDKTTRLCLLTWCCCLLIMLAKLIKLLVPQPHLCLLQFHHWACPQTISSESLEHFQAPSTLTWHKISVPKALGCCWIAHLWTDVGREKEKGAKLKCVVVCGQKSARH